jgi:hypothetical protein
MQRRGKVALCLGEAGETLASGLGALPKHLGRLVTTDTSTPMTASLLILVGAIDPLASSIIGQKKRENAQVSLGGADESAKLLLVLAPHVSESDDGRSLLVNDCSETGLGLDDHVGDTHLPAESGEEDDELDRVDVVGDDDQGGLLGFDQGDAVVETVLDEAGLLVVLKPTG